MRQLIKKIRVENFQSIEDATLEIPSRPSGGGVTTVVGPSSTGKSALIRALHLWAHNATSPQVRAGAKATKVTVTLDDGHDVSIERGKSLSTFTVGQEKYTKAGTSVPDPVHAVTRLATDTPDVHFATQFDKPFLLSESGSTISAVLGRLTHASVLKNASREGARRAQQAQQVSKVRREDAAKASQRLADEFSDLDDHRTRVESAEASLASAEGLLDEAERLQQCAERAQRAVAVWQQISDVPDVPDITDAIHCAETKLAEAERVSELVRSIQQSAEKISDLKKHIVDAQQQSDESEKRWRQALAAAGQCPTCGQVVSSR